MKFDLEDRLIEFAVTILTATESLPETRQSTHLCNQLIRSGTAPALIYGEAQAAESPRDFVHKMKIGLKELRETMITLKIIARKKYLAEADGVGLSINECNELISIFVASVKTALRNAGRAKGS